MFALSEAVGTVGVLRQAGDEKGGVEPAVGEEMGDQRGSGGLAVGAGDDDGALAADKEIAQDFRQRKVGDFAGERSFDLRVAARDGVADYDQIRRGCEMLRRKALVEGDPQILEHGAHRRIDAAVRAGDAIAPLAQHAGQ